MRFLVGLVVRYMMQWRIGRWIISVVLLGLAAIFLIAAFAPAEGDQQQQGSMLVAGLICLLFGGIALFVTIRLDVMGAKTARARKQGEAHAKELLARGDLLPIPALPPQPKFVTQENADRVAGYIRQLDSVPWGQHVTVPEWEARHVFEQTLEEVASVRGMFPKLEGPIQTFASLPKPYCYIGAAHVMFVLSFLSNANFVPAGLRQGLRFTTRAQLHTPLQPDALVIQVKLLAYCSSPQWQDLADKTLVLLRRVAPNHPQLPAAEYAVHLKRKEYDQALAALDRTIAYPPSRSSLLSALSSKAVLLMDLKRYEESLATNEECLALAPEDPWTWHNTSIVYYRMGRYDEALRCNDRALRYMEFGVARSMRENILKKLAEQGRQPGQLA